MTLLQGRPRLLAAGLLALVLVLGGAIGVVLDRTVLRPTEAVSREAPRSARGSGRAARERFHQQLARELDLTPPQQARIDSILERQQERLRSLNREIRPQYDTIFAQTRTAVDSVLTPAQRERFAEMRAEWKRKREKRHEETPRGGV